MKMEVDWDLGVSGHSDDMTEEDEVCHPVSPATCGGGGAQHANAVTWISGCAETDGCAGCNALVFADVVGLDGINLVP